MDPNPFGGFWLQSV